MEKEVMAAVRSGQFPAACEPALRKHVQECKSCSQAASLSLGFAEMRAEASEKALPGAPGLLFWKAQLRRRNQAIEQITRPILAVEIVGFAVTIVVLGLVAWKWITAPNSDMLSVAQNFASMNFIGSWGFLAAATALTICLFGGVVLYLVATKD
jgi:hypothetical protein